MHTSNSEWQRRNNLAVLARAVWQNPGLSRRDLDRRFGIDKSSISRLVQVLIDLGLVETGGRTESPAGEGPLSSGRPPVALRIRPDYGQVWGLALWPDKARLTILNVCGEPLAARERRFQAYDGNWDRYLDQVLDFAVSAAGPLNLPLLGIGFGVPGLVNFDSGTIIASLPFGVHNLAPLGRLADRLPLFWENDANCGAWSCQPLGEGGADSLYVLARYIEEELTGIAMGLSVGFGLVISGRLHRGWRHRAGEYRSAFWGPEDEAACEKDGPPQPQDFLGVACDLLQNLRFAAELLDPRTIYLGGDLKSRTPALAEAAAKVGWDRSGIALQPLPEATDEVSLGAAQLVLDELFQLPSGHRHSLFRDYGNGPDSRLWRGLPPSEIRTLTSAGS